MEMEIRIRIIYVLIAACVYLLEFEWFYVLQKLENGVLFKPMPSLHLWKLEILVETYMSFHHQCHIIAMDYGFWWSTYDLINSNAKWKK